MIQRRLQDLYRSHCSWRLPSDGSAHRPAGN